MNSFCATFGSSDISDTGLAVPMGIALKGHFKNGATRMNGADEDGHGKADGTEQRQETAGIGHNRKISAESWHTAAQQTFDEAAAANTGPGRHLYQLNWLIEIIFDPRLGETPIVVKFLAAAVKYNNRETGTAFPGLKVLAEDIYRDMMQLPPKTAEDIMKKVASLARACGYTLSRKQAPPGGNRAVGHYTFTLPDPDERQQAIAIHQTWLVEENAKRVAKKAAKATEAEVTGRVTSDEVTAPVTTPEVTGRVTSEGSCGNRHRGAEVTANGTHSLYKNNLSLNLHDNGADAPGGMGEGKGLSGGVPAKPKRTPNPKATEEQFAHFWAAYPIREGKAAALKNFRKLTHAEADLAIFGAAQYAAKIAAERERLARRGEQPKIKYAQGWLTERRFEDYAENYASAAAVVSDDPEVELKRFIASADGQAVIREHGPEKGMRIIRDIVLGSSS